MPFYDIEINAVLSLNPTLVKYLWSFHQKELKSGTGQFLKISTEWYNIKHSMVTWNIIFYYICLQSECKHSQSILWCWEAASFLQWSCVNSKPPLYINESFLFNWRQCFQGRQHSEVSEVSLYCSTILTGSPPPRGQSSCSLPWFSHVFCCLAEVSHCSATSRTVKHLCLSTRWCYLSLSYSILYFSRPREDLISPEQPLLANSAWNDLERFLENKSYATLWHLKILIFTVL